MGWWVLDHCPCDGDNDLSPWNPPPRPCLARDRVFAPCCRVQARGAEGRKGTTRSWTRTVRPWDPESEWPRSKVLRGRAEPPQSCPRGRTELGRLRHKKALAVGDAGIQGAVGLPWFGVGAGVGIGSCCSAEGPFPDPALPPASRWLCPPVGPWVSSSACPSWGSGWGSVSFLG